MTLLILGLVLFLGAHSARIFAEGLRARTIASMGELGWKALYSAVSIAGLALIVIGYPDTRAAAPLYDPPTWTRHVAALLVLAAFLLLAAAYVPGTRIKRAVGHPMVLGVKAWALAHLLANGRPGDVVLFGAFLVWAVLDYRAAKARDRAAGTTYPALGAGRDLAALVVGLALYAAFAFWLHARWFGVRPFG